MRLLTTLLSIAAGGLCLAQEARLTGPVSGLVYDEQTRAIRAILGVPGASYLSAPLIEHLDFASVAPTGDRAVAVREGRLSLVTFGTDVEWQTLDGEYAGASRAAWSTDSKSFAVFGAEEGLSLYRDGKLTSLGHPAEISALLVADQVFYASKDGVYAAGESEPRLLASIEGASGLALDGGTLYAASRARNEVLAIRNYAESPEMALLTSEVAAPVALALDNGTLLAASADARALYRLNTSTGEVLATIALDFAPDSLTLFARANGTALYSLRTRASQTDALEVFDAARASAFFVPAAAEIAAKVEE